MRSPNAAAQFCNHDWTKDEGRLDGSNRRKTADKWRHQVPAVGKQNGTHNM